MSLEFSFGDWNDFSEGLGKEWLETNQLGGYAASSITGCHTRKYHGFLNIHVPELNSKFVLLSKVAASVGTGDKFFDLDVNKYPMTFHPKGYEYLKSFKDHLYPKTSFFIEEKSIEIEESVQMLRHENTTIIRYKVLKTKKALNFKFNPLLAFREIHGLTRENLYIDLKTSPVESKTNESFYRAKPYGSMPELFFGGDKIEYFPAPFWVYNIEYSQEAMRGFNYQEDLYCPGIIEKTLNEGDEFFLYFSTKIPEVKISELWNKEEEAKKLDYEKATQFDEKLKDLIYHGKSFLIDSKVNGSSLVAGYPWFAEWGRDAMISLPGLTAYRGEFDKGVNVLKTFAKFQKNGLIPNYLPLGYGETPAYNSIDASLWFFWAIQELSTFEGKKDDIKKEFFKVMGEIIDAYTNEKVENAKLRSNGLIWSGDTNTQLTWMDACAYGRPVTPRYGYAVEINALWYNALGFYLSLASDIDPETHANLTYLFELAGRSFIEVFWDDRKGYLADTVNEKGRDFTIRPNQIFAASLTFSCLTNDQKNSLLKHVKTHLLTPMGLRTLSPESKEYRPYYQGSPDERDSSYHQGTVWPWLLGHYIDGLLRSTDNLVEVKKNMREYLDNLVLKHLPDYGIGSIAEIFDGADPHKPNGAFAQAWSVAEVIRSYMKLK